MNTRIRELRKTLELNQTDFGSRIGVKQGTVASYESGARAPLDSVVRSICREYNVNEDWLRTGQGEMFLSNNRENQLAMWMGRVLSEEEESFKKRLLNVLRGLTEAQWVMIEEKAKELFTEEGSTHS